MSHFWRFQTPKTHIFTKKFILVGSVQSDRNFYVPRKIFLNQKYNKEYPKKFLGQSDFNFKRYSNVCQPPP